MHAMIRSVLLALAALAGLATTPAHAERVRDLGAFQSVRSNQLTGYGIVVGLDGTGDDNFAYVTEAMRGVSTRLGLQLPPGANPALKNAAAVIITADLPAFAKPGQRIDMPVSFYVDPAMLDDIEARGVTEITLSYTMYSADLPETDPSRAEGDGTIIAAAPADRAISEQ